MTKQQVGLLFGGRSGEHEVSISSARAIAQALLSADNASRYTLYPFYISKIGQWHGPEVAQGVLDSGQPLNAEDGDTVNLWSFPPEASQMTVWFPILHGPQWGRWDNSRPITVNAGSLCRFGGSGFGGGNG